LVNNLDTRKFFPLFDALWTAHITNYFKFIIPLLKFSFLD
jgi:hypothetical protein